MIDWRLRSVGVSGDRNVMFIDILPATFMMNVERWEVYSKDCWVTAGARAPLTTGSPILWVLVMVVLGMFG